MQSQLFGFSGGRSITDENCERIKLGKTLYDMGMRVAAVSLMCQDERVFDAMRMAGTPCPYEGLIGAEAQIAWDTAEEEELTENESKPSNRRNCQPRGEDVDEMANTTPLLFLRLQREYKRPYNVYL